MTQAMRSITERVPLESVRARYTVSVLCSTREVRELRESGRHLLKHLDCSSQPDFFLAGLVRNRWAPRVAVVKESDRIAGLVYLKERMFGGFGTGLLYGDSTLGTMVIADPQARSSVFLSGIRALIQSSRVHGLRMAVPPDTYELPLLRELQSEYSLDLQYRPTQHHSILPLDSTYEAFLAGLSSNTRSNFRRYRQRSQAANHRFLKNIRLDEYESAAYELLAEDVVGADRVGIQRALNLLATARPPLLAGLRSEQGEWLSIFGGWYESKRAIRFHQLNSDRKHPQDHLSLVMRAHVIEMLIEHGYRELLSWGGMRGNFSNYLRQVPMLWVYVDKSTFVWQTLLHILKAHHSRLPRSLSCEMEWIVPPIHEP